MQEIPSYWLSRQKIQLTPSTEAALCDLYTREVTPAAGNWLEATLPVPKWVFLCWLAEQREVLLHGSGEQNITTFEPRKPNDRSPDDFSKQTAVFATSDGIWPIFYAVLDRARYRLRFLNGALQFRLSSGDSDMRYFFSVTEAAFRQRPWRDGVVYLLPRDGFIRQPPYTLGRFEVLEPHWARPTPVKPLAKLHVTPADFPFLTQVRAHNEAIVEERSARDPYGFPWLR